MTSSCPFCKSNSVHALGMIPSIASNLDGFREDLSQASLFMKCSDCHLRFRWPMIDHAVLYDRYSGASLNNWQYRFAERIDWVMTADWMHKNNFTGAIMDVGCFDGQFLGHFRGRLDTYGVEINAEASSEAQRKGIKVIGRQFSGSCYPYSPFDLITGFDVIEHVHEPHDFMNGIVQSARKGGHIILSSGNSCWWTWRIEKGRYWYARIPEHQLFISPSWCRYVATAFNLRILCIRSFSHSPWKTPLQPFKETALNMVYMASPTTYKSIRRSVACMLGMTPAGRDADSGPSWATSFDHIWVVFQKGR